VVSYFDQGVAYDGRSVLSGSAGVRPLSEAASPYRIDEMAQSFLFDGQRHLVTQDEQIDRIRIGAEEHLTRSALRRGHGIHLLVPLRCDPAASLADDRAPGSLVGNKYSGPNFTTPEKVLNDLVDAANRMEEVSMLAQDLFEECAPNERVPEGALPPDDVESCPSMHSSTLGPQTSPNVYRTLTPSRSLKASMAPVTVSYKSPTPFYRDGNAWMDWVEEVADEFFTEFLVEMDRLEDAERIERMEATRAFEHGLQAIARATAERSAPSKSSLGTPPPKTPGAREKAPSKGTLPSALMGAVSPSASAHLRTVSEAFSSNRSVDTSENHGSPKRRTLYVPASGRSSRLPAQLNPPRVLGDQSAARISSSSIKSLLQQMKEEREDKHQSAARAASIAEKLAQLNRKR
jgi:hypothetical protein